MKMRVRTTLLAAPWPGRRPRQPDGPSAADVIREIPAREIPYGAPVAPGQAIERALALSDAEEYLFLPRAQPTFTARGHAPAPPTRPQPALRERPLPRRAGDRARTVMEQLASGLRDLDWDALNEAQRAGLTYAQAHAARGRTPLGDAAERHFRPEVRPARRHGEAARRRAEALVYPRCDVTAPVSAIADAYDALMRHVDAITGTRGLGPGRRPLPEITAGGAA